jgi:hypothetical protein
MGVMPNLIKRMEITVWFTNNLVVHIGHIATAYHYRYPAYAKHSEAAPEQWYGLVVR